MNRITFYYESWKHKEEHVRDWELNELREMKMKIEWEGKNGKGREKERKDLFSEHTLNMILN